MTINLPPPKDGTVSRRIYREDPWMIDPYTLELIPPRLVLVAEVPVFDEHGERINFARS